MIQPDYCCGSWTLYIPHMHTMAYKTDLKMTASVLALRIHNTFTMDNIASCIKEKAAVSHSPNNFKFYELTSYRAIFCMILIQIVL